MVKILILLISVCSPVFAQQVTVDSLVKVLKEDLPDSIKVGALNELGIALGSTNTDSALLISEQAMALARQLGDRHAEAWAHFSYGNSYWYTAEDEKGFESYLAGLAIAEELNDSVMLNRAYHGLGILEHARSRMDKSREYLNQALAIAYALNMPKRQTFTELSLAILEDSEGNAEKALIHLQTSLSISERIGYHSGVIVASNFMARIKHDQKKFRDALPYLQNSIKLSKQTGNPVRLADALTNAGRVYTKLKMFNEAHESLIEAIKVSEDVGAISYEQNAYEKLYELESVLGNNQEALRNLVKATALNDSIYNRENARQINELTARFEAEKRDEELALQRNQIALLEKDQEITAIWRNVLIAGIVFIIVAGIILFRSQRQKIIERKKLIEAELENSQLEAKQLELDIEAKNKELTSYTINFIRKRELFDNLENQLKALKPTVEGKLGGEIRNLNRLISENNNIDRDWNDFKTHFENVHKDFFSKLKQLHPTLGTAELRLCSLIKLNMNVKETAAILSISPDSVKTARYRLRKKFGLSSEDSLSEYVINLEKYFEQEAEA